MSDPASLYEQDFYAWTRDQAATLRAWPERLRPNALDIEHLAEEIENLGSSQRNAVQSLLLLARERYASDRAVAALGAAGEPCFDLDSEALNPDWFPPLPAG